jgi:hypothetical protein
VGALSEKRVEKVSDEEDPCPHDAYERRVAGDSAGS